MVLIHVRTSLASLHALTKSGPQSYSDVDIIFTKYRVSHRNIN